MNLIEMLTFVPYTMEMVRSQRGYTTIRQVGNTIPMGMVRDEPQFVEKTPQLLWVILHMEEEVGKVKNIVRILLFVNIVNRKEMNHLLRKNKKLNTKAEKELILTWLWAPTIILAMIDHTIGQMTGIEPIHGGFTINFLDPLGYIHPFIYLFNYAKSYLYNNYILT
ncbi:30S ribosomal protein S19 chloroplastic [Bienertia sinuspersici]